MSDQPPTDDVTGPPPDAQPGDTWSLDAPSPLAGSPLPPPPDDGMLPVSRAQLTEGGAAPPAARHGGLKVVGIALAAVLLLAGAAAAAAFLMLRGSGEAILDKVPANADVVVTAYLDPAASQKVNLFRMAAKFPDLADEGQLKQQLDRALDDILREVGMTHDDVQWVGPEVGLYVDVKSTSDTSFAVLVATDDEGAAQTSLQKLRSGLEANGTTFHTVDHDGVEITVPETFGGGSEPAFAIVDGVVVLGSGEPAVDAVIDTAHGGPSIADDAAYGRVTGALPDARLGVVFVDAAQLLDTFGDAVGTAGLTTGVTSLAALDGVGVSVSAEPEGIAVDTVMMYDDAKLTDVQRHTLSASDHANPLVDLVPHDALGMYALEHLDAAIGDEIDQLTKSDPTAAKEFQRLGVMGPDGLLTQLNGDIAFEATPEDQAIPVGGVLMAGTNDPAATAAWLDHTIKTLPLGTSEVKETSDGGYRIVRHPAVWATEQHGGVTITYVSSANDFPVAYAVIGEVAVVGSSRTQIERVVDVHGGAQAISSDPGFTQATANVPTTDGVLYLDVQAIVDTVRSQLAPGEAASFDQQAGRYLAPIQAVVAGTENGPDVQRTRLFIRIP